MFRETYEAKAETGRELTGEKNRIYSFMTRILKDRGIRINDLYMQCNVSRTTFWRIMYGHQIPAPLLQDTIINLLEMDEFEKSEFLECISQLEFNESEIQAYKIIEETLKDKPVNRAAADMEFIVRDKKKTVMPYGELMDIIRDAAAIEGFKCDITVFTCTGGDMLAPVKMLLDDIKDADITVNHYVRFYRDDNLENVYVFRTIISLLKYGAYKVFARSLDGMRVKEWLDDVILVRLPDKYMALCFGDERYHDCYISDCPEFYTFLSDKLLKIMPLYEELIKERNVGMVITMIQEIEYGNSKFIYKSNPCYDVIEKDIWVAIAGRCVEENYRILFGDLGEEYKSDRVQAVVNSLLDICEKRYNYTYQYDNTHFFTKKGLQNFVDTGRLSDHMDWLPSFTNDEVRRILTNLLKRHQNPDDKLRISIIDQDTDMDLCVVATSADDIIVAYMNKLTGIGDVFNCFFKHDDLSHLLMGFGERYAPRNISISDSEIERFINGLFS